MKMRVYRQSEVLSLVLALLILAVLTVLILTVLTLLVLAVLLLVLILVLIILIGHYHVPPVERCSDFLQYLLQ